MSLFHFLKREQVSPATTAETTSQPLPEIEERVFSEAKPDNTIKPAVAAADSNIMLLYAFLDRNHEAKGYDDALLNPDTSHLAQNLDSLKNELVRTINKVKTFYEDFIRETEFHILSRSRSGMVDIVEELEMKKTIALGHIDKVREIEDKTAKEAGDCQGILLSYARGFKNGLAAISHHQILTRRF
ncbi:hypothetical protein [Mucilaginibacter paludis]|uniref:Uncharacterized protein n=1 Tax=Mucilaginibacter paludis DSM 18603 TaxID=714943 RepID=H1Y8H4_9SPHI|nr:hypothetical protein [Mucilaginibacter paludis]EHQ25892.1 hypothetical protein Mucpa_1738 [Mucilaginibacter paludis DSM 18603]